MVKELKFFRCKHCGNIIQMVVDAGVPVKCCGEVMEELTANTVDASREKHLPEVSIEGNTVLVEVGSIAHPMEEKHYIQWIYIQTQQGGQVKYLEPGETPKATFCLDNDKVLAAYEYCNIHGLWKTDI